MLLFLGDLKQGLMVKIDVFQQIFVFLLTITAKRGFLLITNCSINLFQ